MAEKFTTVPRETTVAIIAPVLFDFSASAQTFRLLAPFRCIVKKAAITVVEVIGTGAKSLTVKNGSATVLTVATAEDSAAGAVVSASRADADLSSADVFEAGDEISLVSVQAAGTGTGYCTIELVRV